jgi:hypothetical protein
MHSDVKYDHKPTHLYHDLISTYQTNQTGSVCILPQPMHVDASVMAEEENN